jgi:cysteine-rich repeat protein
MCDDGNNTDGDGCEANCTTVCGDGITAGFEQCDDGNLEGGDGCSPTCTTGLTVAIENNDTSCLGSNQPGSILAAMATALEARGHIVTIVEGADLDTANEINAFDVVVLGGWTSNCNGTTGDLDLFDDQIPQYLAQGGGLVGSGWVLFGTYLDASPNIEAALPMLQGNSFEAAGSTFDPISGHPITTGIFTFDPAAQVPRGGGAQVGATVLATSNGEDVAAAWGAPGGGRSVYLGLMYGEDPLTFPGSTQLLDGSIPDAEEVFQRAVAWAGGLL